MQHENTMQYKESTVWPVKGTVQQVQHLLKKGTHGAKAYLSETLMIIEKKIQQNTDSHITTK